MATLAWSEWLQQLNGTAIDTRLAQLKDIIRNAQEEIVCLTIVRKGIERKEEFRKISKKKVEQAIDEAIAEANGDSEAASKLRITSEGTISA
jgi:phosphoribosyl-dephospho-CoA transferase